MNFLITFRTYGTWLHGDERGSVNRDHNQYREALLDPNSTLSKHRERLMNSDAVVLNEEARNVVDRTIQEVATHRGWTILALNVLGNHVHIVVSVPEEIAPEKVMADFKSWSTRRLREASLILPKAKVWAEHGSTRYLHTAEPVYAACHYVIHGQHLDAHNMIEPGS